MKQRFFILLMLCLAAVMAWGQQPTGVTGITVDAQTGDTLPFVQIYFIRPSSEGNISTGIGTTSGMDGRFSIQTQEDYTTLCFQMMGYKTEMLTLRKGQVRRHMVVKLQPDVYGLQDIVVTPKHRKQKYKRKGNPAVELIKEVIAHKDSANVISADRYLVESYDKTIFALDKFDFDFNKSKFWRQFMFVRDFVDTAAFNKTPILTIDVRENLADVYYQRKPHRKKTLLRAKRICGVEDIINIDGMEDNIQSMFQEVNIYQNNISLLYNRFVSPLSSDLAVSYYQYYIQDTLMVDGTECIDLAFVPVNSESYSFTGHLYVVNDSTYKLKKYAINVPPHINMNFVSDLSIMQSFERLDCGLWAPQQTETYAKFSIIQSKKARALYAHQTRMLRNYDLEAQLNDSLFTALAGDVVVVDSAVRYTKQQWNEMKLRPVPLNKGEYALDSLIATFLRQPTFRRLAWVGESFAGSFIPTSKVVKESKWDFLPLLDLVSWNTLEGVRLRVGGMTTAKMHPNFFMNGYVAYGFRHKNPNYNPNSTEGLDPYEYIGDNRFKYSLTLIYSFNKKKKHAYEAPRHSIEFTSSYDANEPGKTYQYADRDHMLMSIPTSKPTLGRMQYQGIANLKYHKEWPVRLGIETWLQFERNWAAGTLSYDRIVNSQYDENGVLTQYETEHVPFYDDFSWSIRLRYAPGEPASLSRLGKESPFNMDKDAPIISLQHNVGYLTTDYSNPFGAQRTGQSFFYQSTEVSAEKRFWLSAFGHIDTRFQAGIMWNKVPYAKLYIPPTNSSIFLGLNSFNLMRPMEFQMDQYLALYATYYLKGWIMNRIPGINRLKLRGVVSFSGIYGGLSDKNNPTLGGDGLYELPVGVSPIGKVPYMEMTAGFENIFKFIRIDYVRRLNYNEGLGPWQKNTIKVTFRLAL